ncbi:hypothetical protein [Pedobacter jamesrossensis]|uniref:Uncharacterized protein n=1 Tax=Pedobacter jamesrossensis TaxID=1908238 RepID=A0ABV8NJG0_9SPHI
MELTKAENRIARNIFAVALQRELAKEMEVFNQILQKWKSEPQTDHRDSYYELFTAVKDFDKHIARRYDGLKNSWFYGTLIGLLADEIINEKDLTEYSEETRSQLINGAKRRNEND